MRSPGEALASFFVKPRRIRAAEQEKIIPLQYTGGRRKSYSREIVSQTTGKVIAYEQDGGGWINATNNFDEHSDAIIAMMP